MKSSKVGRWARSRQARHKPPQSEGGPCWYSMIGGQRRHFEHNAVEGGVASLKAPRPRVASYRDHGPVQGLHALLLRQETRV